ncbi:cell wall hydrolase [Paenibacillus sp.]|uniref:cell wall hydrolase n=1 Tax=Paenibacillus sp. TaxID=58172 RepID=UPI0028B0FA64|nr:cell wall hydrolase [Paenibacillus sp.]
MLIFKKNRYIALLVGVILVCFSAISLMQPNQVAEGKIDSVQMDQLQSTSRASVISYLQEESIASKTRGTNKVSQTNKLYNIVNLLSSTWKPAQNVEWLSKNKIKPQNTAQASIVRVKADVAQSSPAAQKAQMADTAKKSAQTVVKAVSASQKNPLTTLYFSRTELLSQEQQSKATRRYAVSEEELLLLQKIVMAEAEGEPYQGKVAVANVVLNRLRSAKFPDTIYKVIYQKHQFSPVANGRLKRVKPSDDSIKAVNAALSGVKEVPDDTYFFLSLKLAQDLTVHHSQEYVKTIGNHTFYK